MSDEELKTHKRFNRLTSPENKTNAIQRYNELLKITPIDQQSDETLDIIASASIEYARRIRSLEKSREVNQRKREVLGITKPIRKSPNLTPGISLNVKKTQYVKQDGTIVNHEVIQAEPRKGTKYNRLTDEFKGEIFELVNKGHSINQISKNTELSAYIIRKIIEENQTRIINQLAVVSDVN